MFLLVLAGALNSGARACLQEALKPSAVLGRGKQVDETCVEPCLPCARVRDETGTGRR